METDKLEALLKAATPGPWRKRRNYSGEIEIYPAKVNGKPKPKIGMWAELAAVMDYNRRAEKTANAALIAAAPDLAAEVLRLRSDLAERESDLSLVLEERNRLRAEQSQTVAANAALVAEAARLRDALETAAGDLSWLGAVSAEVRARAALSPAVGNGGA